MVKLINILAAAAMAATTATAANAVEFIKNGGFETALYKTNSQFGAGFGGQGVANWTGLGGTHLQFWYGFGHGAGGTPTTPADSAVNQFGDPRAYFYPSFNTLSPNGGAFVGLDGDPGANGQISQTVTGLTIGDTYILKFNWGAAQLANRVGATTEMLKVSFGVDTVSTPLVANPSKGFSGWINQTFKFKALSKSQTLSFLSIGTPRGLPPVAVLDGVSLTGGGVPEPASWAMMILGMGGLGVVLRRNRVARGARA